MLLNLRIFDKTLLVSPTFLLSLALTGEAPFSALEIKKNLSDGLKFTEFLLNSPSKGDEKFSHFEFLGSFFKFFF